MSAADKNIAELKAELDKLRARVPHGLNNFEHSQNIEITFTSNAIEGNTLTAVETTLVVEQGVTIAGRPLRDHLEALDHFAAIKYVRELARNPAPMGESDVRNLHQLVLMRSKPELADCYADQGRFVLTEVGRHAFPAPAQIPALMADFASWLAPAPNDPAAAFEAHRRLVDIHPFNDGNGRTARLLMNLILLRAGYPPIAIGPAERAEYIAALQESQSGKGHERFDRLMSARLLVSLDETIAAAKTALP